MDNTFPYKASLTREQFLFYEMRETAKLLSKGISADDTIKEIIQEQNEFNAKIMKNDLVAIIKQTISDKDFVDIELYEGDEND